MEITATEFLEGISHELKFWKGFVKTDRFLSGWVKNVKTPELHPLVYDFVSGFNIQAFNVLDVGSGVVSILNGTVTKENLISVDPLGGLYECIFDYEKYKIRPCLPLPAEEMAFEDKFDIVHMSNAIDHSQDPVKTFDKLWKACKKGGYVILQGFENEGTFENWQGFHQWDISQKDDTLFIRNQKEEISQIQVKSTIVSEHIQFENKTWYIWIVQKS
jgi:SAM-dependent methyltransferase